MRRSEIIVPLEIEQLFQVHCAELDTTSGLLDEDGAYSVLIALSAEECHGPHTFKKIQL